MSRRNRIFLGILVIYLAGMGLLLQRVAADLDPRYRESAEESLVETAQLLATLVEQDVRDGRIATDRLAPLFREAYARRFEARIFNVTKTGVSLRAYVTDAAGTVLYDSQGRAQEQDFSQWRDVALTLRGAYGARTTLERPEDPASGVMYVAAPIRWQGRTVGVLSVGKPEQSFGQFVQAARRQTLLVGLVSVLGVALLALMVSVWLVRPFALVSDTLRQVRAQRRPSPAQIARRAWGLLAAAYGEMRDALAGRSYVADYVQTLTHEVKSPLSAIRGAAELLQEPGMEAAERQRFLANITRETGRIQELVDRMMELTVLETLRRLERVAPVPLRPLLEEAAASAQAAAAARGIRVVLDAPQEAQAEGDAFLLRRAVGNLLDNAIEFSPAGGQVRLALRVAERQVCIEVQDQGPGIPAYAQDKLFEKFYSLARPHSGKKSTGLGLAFVREIAALHGGRITLGNAPGGGALAVLRLPAG